MVNIPTMEAGKDYYVVQLNAKDFTGAQTDSGDSQKYWSTDAGNWVDMVFDVSLKLSYVQEFTVRFDVRKDALDAYIKSPAGTFYMDAASIDANPDPRTVVVAPTTSVNNPITSGLKIYSSNRTIVVDGNVASVQIYNMLGKSIVKLTDGKMRTEIPVSQSGVYLVKAVSANGNISSTKVLVK